MVSDLLNFSASGGAIVATWWLHSTLLIGGAWLACRFLPKSSHRSQEIIWKTAAFAGFITTAIQVSCGTGTALLSPQPISDIRSPVTWRHEESFEPPTAGLSFEEELPSNTSSRRIRDAVVELTAIAALALPSRTTLKQDPPAGPGVAEAIIEEFDPSAQNSERNSEEAATLKSPSVAGNITKSSPATATGSEQPGFDPSEDSERHALTKPEIRYQLLSGLFLACCAWFLSGVGRLAVQYRQVRQQLNGTNQAPPQARHSLNEIRREVRCPTSIELRTSLKQAEPAATGLFRLLIVLPEGIEANLSRGELRAVLSHEVAHFVRGDLWWLHAGRLLTCCLGFQPLHLLAVRRWQLCAEFQCDDWATSHCVPPTDLARGLTSVAQARGNQTSLVGGLAAAGHRGHVSERVEALLSDDRPAKYSNARALLAGIGSCIVASSAVIAFGPHTLAQNVDVPSQTETARPMEPSSADPQDEPDELLSVQAALTGQLKIEAVGLRYDIRILLSELQELTPALQELGDSPELQSKAEQLERRLREIENFAGTHAPLFDELQRNRPSRTVGRRRANGPAKTTSVQDAAPGSQEDSPSPTDQEVLR